MTDCTEARGLIGADLLGRLEPGERARSTNTCVAARLRAAARPAEPRSSGWSTSPARRRRPRSLRASRSGSSRVASRRAVTAAAPPPPAASAGPAGVAGRSALGGLVAGAAVRSPRSPPSGRRGRSEAGAPAADLVGGDAGRDTPRADREGCRLPDQPAPRRDHRPAGAGAAGAEARRPLRGLDRRAQRVSYSAGIDPDQQRLGDGDPARAAPPMHGSTMLDPDRPAHGGNPAVLPRTGVTPDTNA